MPPARLNGHQMYWEVHGTGDPLLLSGGWGTFCHGAERHIPQGLTDRYSVVIFDHRGLAQSDDDLDVPASTALYADDVLALADHLEIEQAHLVGIVGIGACIFQEVALRRPSLARTLVNTGCWAKPDPAFEMQLRLWLDVHTEMGFEAFQRLVVLEAFDPGYLATRGDALLGPNGGWHLLRDNLPAHRRFTEASLAHNTLDRLHAVSAPSLVVHNGRDRITAPRLTVPVEQAIPGAQGYTFPDAAHVITGSAARAELSSVIVEFLATH